MESRDLVAQLGSEVAAVLSSALDRVLDLSATGRIDRSGLRALRYEIELARRAGITGQQLARLDSDDLTLQRERLNLTQLLRDLLVQRARDTEARGTEVRQQLEQTEVISDPTLLFALLQSMLDWSFQHAVSRIDLRLDIQSWPAHARLSCAFFHVAADETPPLQPVRPDQEEARLNTMSWKLLQRTAGLLGLPLQRTDGAVRTQVVVEFPNSGTTQVEAPTPLPGLEAAENSLGAQQEQPLAGRRVLVLAPRPEVRNVVREALRPTGLMVEIVATIDETIQACAAGLPHALVYEQATAGDEFELVRQGLLNESPNMAFISISDEGKAFEILNEGGRSFASVGRADILESLPAALLFELSRQP